MIHAAGEGFDHTFHLELEQESGQLSDRQACLHADDIQLQVVGLLKETDDLLFFWCQVWEEISFDSIGERLLQSNLILPTHRLHKVIGTGDEGCPIISDEVIAAF